MSLLLRPAGRIRAAGICTGCGAVHRTIRRPGHYACARCGLPLDARRRWRFPAWGIPVLATLLGGLLIIGAARARLKPAPAAELAPPPPVGARLPPDAANRLLRKIDLVRADLAIDPAHVPLRTRLAEYYLYLSLILKEKPAASEKYRRLCAREVQRLKQAAPEVGIQLEIDLELADELTLQPGAGLTLATAGWNSRLSGPQASPAVESVQLPGGGGRPRTTADIDPLRYYPGADVARIGASSGRIPDPQLMAAEAQIVHFQNELQRDPHNVRLLDAYAFSLYQRGQQEVRLYASDPRLTAAGRRRYLEAAAKVYSEASEQTPMQIHKAAFAVREARIWRDLEEWEDQYAALKKACNRAPYSADVWREFQAVCLQTLRYAESRAAGRMVREWTFPVLRPPGKRERGPSTTESPVGPLGR